jgi:Domain of unknown function (DUF4383)
MLRFLAILFGVFLIVIGILGFLTGFSDNGLLFGYFLVNPVHNLIHLVSGIIAILCGLKSGSFSKVFFIIFGLLYLALGLYGFYLGKGMMFDLIAINQSDNFFHVILAVVLLYLGLFVRSK